ncbi:probable UDP-3-O-acyl-N-acetylglucosamine deacetylase 1, mitochondrial isoform X2 [Zingiber officinale]|uniref:probable UDP-3-O-acyl-N-acetylglucosamine deacetylase 1, mitochondrial isoform X2 n=1 Tax=Zingiber officinale TaxID=94328 RepID=UPI001C4B2103|nr:probable UDP-3-O-acyl-N-acetylglucosamine deacetylase 1, mitochondrial isoform X2 [Zingiber officinale]
MPSPLLSHSRRLLSSHSLALTSISRSISRNSTGRNQQTLASSVTRSGTALHSGNFTTVRLIPAAAGEGRYFVVRNLHSRKGTRIPASIDHVVNSALCTTLCRDGVRVRTVEHLLSALEACGVDNCRIEIDGGEEVPLLDGSAKQWVEAIKEAGLYVANDHNGCSLEKLVPKLHEPLYLCHRNSFLIAFPSPNIHITYGIDFSKIPAIATQWFSSFVDESIYCEEIASARTFCIYEEVEGMRQAGLIKGGSVDNAIVCRSCGRRLTLCSKWKSGASHCTHNCL